MAHDPAARGPPDRGRLGKLIRLGALLREHEAIIDLDLLEHLGVDLWPDLGTRRLPYARLLAFVDHPPPLSRLSAALDPDWFGWTPLNSQVATLIDVGRLANWLRFRHLKPEDRPPVPEPSYRPHMATEMRRRAEAEAAKAERKRSQANDYIARVRARQGGGDQ